MNCLIDVTCWFLEERPSTIIRELGVTGDEKMSYGQRGIHVQEIMRCFLKRHYVLCIIESEPRLGNEHGHIEVPSILDKCLNDYDGIIFGESPLGNKHTYGWYEGKLYDPLQRIDSLINVPTIDFFAIVAKI